jgi:hypothetical protein
MKEVLLKNDGFIAGYFIYKQIENHGYIPNLSTWFLENHSYEFLRKGANNH